MAADVVDVFNLALSSLGTRSSVAAVDEVSREAEQCSLWYEPVRDQILRAAPWPSATGIKRLALLAERDESVAWATGAPHPGWRFAYAPPSDMLRPRYFAETYANFILSTTNGVPALMTQGESPLLIYTTRQTRVDLWDSDLLHAIAFGLAAHIAKSITGKDSDLQNMFELASQKIAMARANAANEQSPGEIETIPDWIAARGYAGSGPVPRYIYPPADFSVPGIRHGQ